MLKRAFTLLSLLFLAHVFAGPTPIRAQEWVEHLFEIKEHDFGTVPRDAKAEFRFEMENPFEEEIEFGTPRSSCVCSTPRLESPKLKTFEKGALVVHFNSDLVRGPQKATITIPILKPYPSRAVLHVRGHVRNDISFEPGFVQFNDITLGEGAEKKVKVIYQGNKSIWNIREIQCENPYLEILVENTNLYRGRIEVELKIKLSEEAPAGMISERVFLKTNDSAANEIPLMIEGEVKSPLRVHPQTLYLGTVCGDATIVKPVILIGEQPFLIKSLSSSNKLISVELNGKLENSRKTRHVLSFSLRPKEVAERKSVKETLKFETDYPEINPTLDIFAVVKPKDAPGEEKK